MLAKEGTDYQMEVREWLHAYKHDTGEEAEVLNPESIEGEIFCTSHDILAYPTVVVLDQNSSILKQWNIKLPQIEEVTYVMRSI